MPLLQTDAWNRIVDINSKDVLNTIAAMLD